jgi:two-component system cell cycle sensor histidine kinase/response regulator CckA
MLGRSLGTLHRVELGPLAPGSALLDEGGLEQIVVNLVVNARDALPDGGPIAVRVLAAPVDGRDGLQLEVSDAGTGMSEADQARIFDPFFTTKPAGRGTGLGLATVHGIVSRAEGRLTVETSLGAGSTFRVWLPTCAAAEASAEPATTTPAAPRKVLVVDDEPGVRRAVATLVRAAGHDVAECDSGAAAVDLFARGPAPFDAVVCDVRMPGLDGFATAERIRALHPRVRIVLMSGFHDPGHPVAAVDAFLHKPFGGEALATALVPPAASA